MKKRRSVELRKHIDFRVVIATICFAVATFCFLNYNFPAVASKGFDATMELVIPNINLSSEVAPTHMDNRKIVTPDTIVGSFSRATNKTLLVGHSTTAFEGLDEISISDEIIFNNNKYIVTQIELADKNVVNMDLILAPAEQDTLVLMTCAGELYENGDASQRLIITALSV